MDIKTIASHLWPFWIAGFIVILSVIKSSNKDLMRIDKKAIFSWIKILCGVTVYRLIAFKLFPHPEMFDQTFKTIASIPIPTIFMVPWEDALHCLPLVLFQRLIGTKWYTIPLHALAFAVFMVAFGLGHMYQGLYAAIPIMIYIPISVTMGKKNGFGTVMICHILYDLSTILLIKFMVG